ncbi:DEAD/DEAH box helicase [Terriglobus tenax]|uniref:DEAD/DEAH box helicase n=1 Tax=Terriglobus tenax TaxID=1111115 RepID=UPI0021E0B3A8|nr:DEAD/DEAH box helicase [Terriglobus tenax]
MATATLMPEDTFTDPAMEWAHPVVREWFLRKFGSPTEPQIAGWPQIAKGGPVLISAPTGSGKTLSAFLVCIDALLRQAIEGRLEPYTQVVYVSPLKALSNDVQKNLDGPLREIQALALERGYLCPEIRTGVRTGDTLQKDRAAMLKRPPHILVTTPESLYMMLTASKARENLRRVRTVIVDEIHAVADDKRGAHLALTLERLDALVRGENKLCAGGMLTGLAEAPQRIGLSATQNPIELVGNFLAGEAGKTTIVQVGQRRQLDLAIEVPSEELGSVTSNRMWDEIYDKLAAFTDSHRSTLVFVNTRRLVERLAFNLAERLGAEHVAAHHGSLSRALRLDAEQKLKAGEIKILIATASLELGIDIGDVDLVCQIATTRAVAVAMQRVGRAGHWRGAIPKGRFFATTRDDLMEQAALIRAMRAGDLDKLEIPPAPRDVLMQQIVAAVGAEPWREDDLFAVFKRAWPYRDLSRETFDELVALLHQGIESSRGRYGAYLMRDGVRGELHARRGARMTAIGNGGAIPDVASYAVMLQPENVQIATLDEHFAVDSGPGDVVLLGNTSWRVLRVEAEGRVLVEDAQGAPPTMPFWEGEAPQRTEVLSEGVGRLREEIADRVPDVLPGPSLMTHVQAMDAAAWLAEECGVCESGARQLVTYMVEGKAVLGAVPTRQTIIAERFFDEGGGMQLILHAPFGGRVNKAWGLALRKRFCRGFNFELQAAATDNGINICLAEQHSFPLADVFHFLTVETAKELLEQASLASPIFKARWRWAAGRSLQLLRFVKGKRVAPQIQRTRSEDLLASVFPQAAACFENIEGDIQIPDHPLVGEVMQDVLHEAMDLDGLIDVLRGIADGTIQCLAVDTPAPSQFAHELINAMPYAFLDEAGLEERRARAVSLRRGIPDAVLAEEGKLDPLAIAEVRKECWPDVRDAHELHDLLFQLVALPVERMLQWDARHWPAFFESLAVQERVKQLRLAGRECWVAAERLPLVEALWGDGTTNKEQAAASKEEALKPLLQGWMQLLGPATSRSIAETFGLDANDIFTQMVLMESQGVILRGVFEGGRAAQSDTEIEWCERRLLQRIHRRTVGSLRRAIEPVSQAVYMRWLLEWQHLAGTKLTGEEGLLTALEQLEGFEAPAIEWERAILPSRLANYDPRWLDHLCLSGVIGWGRVSPHPAWGDGSAPRRVIPTNMAPITFYLRETADWLGWALEQKQVDETKLAVALSDEANRVRNLLRERGACFAADIQRVLLLSKQQTQMVLWELATAGLASADGWDQLRVMMDPKKKPAVMDAGRRGVRSHAGRWSLLTEDAPMVPETAIERARRIDAAHESAARMLLNRYGVLFRELLARESNAPRWRDLVGMLRRMEARGEIRGGRFVIGVGGEQFALAEAVDSLRQMKSRAMDDREIVVAAADPMNLVGVVMPGERIAAMPRNVVRYRNGICENTREPDPQPAMPAQQAPIQNVGLF